MLCVILNCVQDLCQMYTYHCSSCYVKFIRLHLFSLCNYLHNSCCFKWMVAACLQVSKCYSHLSIIHCVSSSQLFTHESKLLIQHVCSIILSWCCSILQSFVQNLLCLICILLHLSIISSAHVYTRVA